MIEENLLNFEEALKQVKGQYTMDLLNAPAVFKPVTSHVAQAPGKFIRAFILLVMAMNREGKIPANTVSLAISVELLHLGTLIHDDVIDNSDMRRGIESVHKKFDIRTAVIAGDYFFGLALASLSKLSDEVKDRHMESHEKDIKFLTSSFKKICAGELLEHMHSWDLDLSVTEYLKIISGKTASLMSLSAFAGAKAGGMDDKKNAMYAGYNYGMMFQLLDDSRDYFDIEQGENSRSKPVKKDLAEGVVTLPLIYAMELQPDIKNKLKKYKDVSEIFNDENFNEACQKGVQRTVALADKYKNKALMYINKIQNNYINEKFFVLTDNKLKFRGDI